MYVQALNDRLVRWKEVDKPATIGISYVDVPHPPQFHFPSTESCPVGGGPAPRRLSDKSLTPIAVSNGNFAFKLCSINTIA